jgi:ElaB/YqjD/DUF883 family membrane-anchored ribosome-binding protein
MSVMDEIKKLFDDIEAILKRDGKTLGDLARELDRSYNQVYDWVRLRKFNPRAGPLFQLQAWRNNNIKKAVKRVSAKTATTK